MNILGIDPSLTNTAIVLISPSGKRLDSWLIQTKPKDGDLITRLGVITKRYLEIICKVKCSCVGIEDTMRVGGFSTVVVSMVQGALSAVTLQSITSDKLYFVNNSSWKAHLRKESGLPLKSKEDTKHILREVYHIDETNEHIADAIGVALFVVNTMQM